MTCGDWSGRKSNIVLSHFLYPKNCVFLVEKVMSVTAFFLPTSTARAKTNQSILDSRHVSSWMTYQVILPLILSCDALWYTGVWVTILVIWSAPYIVFTTCFCIAMQLPGQGNFNKKLYSYKSLRTFAKLDHFPKINEIKQTHWIHRLHSGWQKHQIDKIQKWIHEP